MSISRYKASILSTILFIIVYGIIFVFNIDSKWQISLIVIVSIMLVLIPVFVKVESDDV